MLLDRLDELELLTSELLADELLTDELPLLVELVLLTELNVELKLDLFDEELRELCDILDSDEGSLKRVGLIGPVYGTPACGSGTWGVAFHNR